MITVGVSIYCMLINILLRMTYYFPLIISSTPAPVSPIILSNKWGSNGVFTASSPPPFPLSFYQTREGLTGFSPPSVSLLVSVSLMISANRVFTTFCTSLFPPMIFANKIESQAGQSKFHLKWQPMDSRIIKREKCCSMKTVKQSN